MEKISGIVPRNGRTAQAVDTKNAAAARPGMPAFGRPAGVSTQAVAKTSSTASRAVALHKGMREAKEAISQERVLNRQADDFFMSRVRRPEDQPVSDGTPIAEAPIDSAPVRGAPVEGAPISVSPIEGNVRSTEELVLDGESVPLPDESRDYTPRGSYVDVRA